MNAAEDLSLEKLVPGIAYTYCVRAIGVVVDSASTCIDHVIRWESSVEFKVTLPPTAGSVPSPDTTIQYRLVTNDGSTVEDANGTAVENSVLTGIDGSALVEFNFVPAAYSEFYRLKYTVQKTTLSSNDTFIQHNFLCDGGTNPCAVDGNVVPTRFVFLNRNTHEVNNVLIGI